MFISKSTTRRNIMEFFSMILYQIRSALGLFPIDPNLKLKLDNKGSKNTATPAWNRRRKR